MKKRRTYLCEVSPCPQRALAGILSIEGIESSKLVESDSPESSRTSKIRYIGMSIFDEEGKSIAAKETNRIDLIYRKERKKEISYNERPLKRIGSIVGISAIL